MERDAEATRRRLLDAAFTEFADHGISGARVDRIARNAASNKAQIYHYFGGKEQLFDAVFADIVAAVVREVPIDPADLPGYAARLARGYDESPRLMRLVAWRRLERGDDPPHPDAVVSNRHKIEVIRSAQETGDLSTRFPADVLLGLVLHVAALWTVADNELESVSDDRTPEERYRIVADAVALLVA